MIVVFILEDVLIHLLKRKWLLWYSTDCASSEWMEHDNDRERARAAGYLFNSIGTDVGETRRLKYCHSLLNANDRRHALHLV